MVGLSRYRSNVKMGDVEDCLKVALCTQVSQHFTDAVATYGNCSTHLAD